jgi:hypothetical protein
LKKSLVLAAAAVAVLVLGPGAAGAAALTPASPPTVYAKEVKGALKFVAPAAVYQGEDLTFLSETNPRKVGPHTFSLVTKEVLPKTKNARKNCFTPKHICLSIAKWHELNPKTGKIGLTTVDAGPEGWSTLGNNSKEGDSWFSGETKAGTSITKTVTADPATTPELYFFCAIHPAMQAKTKVLPAVAPPVS